MGIAMSNSRESAIHYRVLDATPVGRLLLAADTSGIRHLHFKGGRALTRHPLPPKSGPDHNGEHWSPDTGQLDGAVQQLNEWFEGERTEFDLPLAPQGTDFQLRVWTALQEIPWGETMTYGELAERIGQPSASRAVGLANGRNPISIIIPCHRVIGSNGRLVGYGGGLERKRILLQIEDSWPSGSDRQTVLFDKHAAASADATVIGSHG